MAHEENIKQELVTKFGFLTDKINIKRERRIFAETPSDNFYDVFGYTVKMMKFTYLCTITGLDEGDNLSFIYHLAKTDGTTLSLKTSVSKAHPVIRTITEYFPGGIFYERELVDLLGAKVEGLPEGNRYPLTDDWPQGQHPLRKDWKSEMLDQAKKPVGGE